MPVISLATCKHRKRSYLFLLKSFEGLLRISTIYRDLYTRKD